jgi:hypothetical protein
LLTAGLGKFTGNGLAILSRFGYNMSDVTKTDRYSMPMTYEFGDRNGMEIPA